MNKIKWFFGLLVLLFVGLLTIPNSSEAFNPDDCSENGVCEDLCGEPGQIGCIISDCGSGSQLCTKAEGDPGLPVEN
jgi:hypothetical protein